MKTILIANRGEIAVRIIRTCKKLGFETVAVYSENDEDSMHTRLADVAVCIGPRQAEKSYLNTESILAAAKAYNVDMIHPGVGFLSESADFRDECTAAGIVFIGPDSDSMRMLGDKQVARATMIENGFPVVPGSDGPVESIKDAILLAKEIGYPLMIKAAYGGGGKGIRRAGSEAELDAAFDTASAEAKSAFGNGDIYLEKYIDKPRHVEFQILADAHGNAIHLLERECSIQRRHQKIIEETPSPALTPELREAMGQAAVAAARASGYVNAGTVEFLLDQDGRFYFLEVNTRLQVEHPITEMITGIDLVRQQIEIAAGNPLRLSQEDVVGRGHAIECRIYAEDPLSAFMPSPGRIQFVKEPRGPGIRNDTGVYSGFTVPMEYDPILAKLIVHGGSRKACLERMTRALHDYVILGVLTPIPFLVDVLRSEAFVRGDTYTDFIETHFAGWQPGTGDADLVALAYVIDQAAGKKAVSGSARADAEESSPWRTLGNFRP